MPVSTVFISYSHRDEKWKDKLLPFLKSLEQAGVAMVAWQDRQIDAGAEWHPAIRQAMKDAAAAVLLISADYLASGFCVKEEVPYLLELQEQAGMLLIPVLIRPCPWKAHRWLAARQMLPRDGKSVAIDFPDDHSDIVFSEVADLVLDHFSKLFIEPQTAAALPEAVQTLVTSREIRREGNLVELIAAPEWPSLDPSRVDLSHLPETGAALFGRDDTLTFLDQAWSSQGADTRILAFKAQGGVGKSTLINHWLAEMRRNHFRGATRVFGWSFYSQGVREQGAPSADAFVAAALTFFGDEMLAASAASPWDKGQRLARLVGAERALLVLDGMEPLQSAHPVDRGKLRDPALEALLRGLAKQSAGLCIITTREPLAELGEKSGIVECDLEQITPQAGRALLRALHVTGTDAELESLAARFGPHALAISLLGIYLHEQPGRRIEPATALEQMPGKTPVDRVLAGFEKWLGSSAELEALRLLGFFDRPADEGCLHALRAQPAIPGLTELLAGMADTDWPRVLARLDKLRLIHARHGDTGKRFVDTHPIIREHFAEQLREKNPDAWREGHRRLYEYLCATTPNKLQPTLEDLQPLYQAVAHGCQAGLQQEACDDVYFTRILRRDEEYSWRKLGAFGSDLGAAACFFETPWNCVSSALTEADQAWALNAAAFHLRALGRLTEALESMRASLEMRTKQEAWQNAAISAGNLSEMELMLGEVAGAVGDAEQSVTYADRSGDAFQRVGKRSTHADALHQAGHRTEAEARFREAEQIQIERQTGYQLLYSLPGFRYCDLLLAASERAGWQVLTGNIPCEPSALESPESSDQPTGEQVGVREGACTSLIESCRVVSQRAGTALEIVLNGSRNLLDIALNHLTLGRAALYAVMLERSAAFTPLQRPNESAAPNDDEPRSDQEIALQTARRQLDAAVAGLRRAGTLHHIPRGLLTRAWCSFAEASFFAKATKDESAHKPRGAAQEAAGLFSRAEEDLDEAWEIAERGPMKLFLADIHLYRARLFGSRNSEVGSANEAGQYPWESPAADLAAAEKLIKDCGYHRRDEELADAKAILVAT